MCNFATPILGDVDFAVTSRRENPAQQELFEREWFLRAEVKKGTSHSLIDSYIQLSSISALIDWSYGSVVEKLCFIFMLALSAIFSRSWLR